MAGRDPAGEGDGRDPQKKRFFHGECSGASGWEREMREGQWGRGQGVTRQLIFCPLALICAPGLLDSALSPRILTGGVSGADSSRGLGVCVLGSLDCATLMSM